MFRGDDCQGEIFEGRPEHFVGGQYSAAEDGNTRPRFGGENGQMQGQLQASFVTDAFTVWFTLVEFKVGGTEVSELG